MMRGHRIAAASMANHKGATIRKLFHFGGRTKIYEIRDITASRDVLGFPAKPQHNVSLTWNPSPDTALNPTLTYNVYRSTSCAGGFSKRNSAPVSATNYFDASVPVGSYCYQVTSVLDENEGSPSNQATVVIGSPALAQHSGCSRLGNLVSWLRCIRSFSRAQPKKKSLIP